jgi:hypothetical protein
MRCSTERVQSIGAQHFAQSARLIGSGSALGAPKVPLPPDRIDQMALRQRAQVRIGVRAAGNKTNEQNGRGSAQGKPSVAINKACELTTTYTTLARNA